MIKKKKKSLPDLEAIKRLLILSLLKQGLTSQEIGRALRVDSSVIRHMIPVRKVRKSSKS
jgi:ribosomal protein S6